jgi:hypothetical protein
MPPENDPPPTGGGSEPPAGGQPPPSQPDPPSPVRPPPGVPEGVFRELQELRAYKAQSAATEAERRRLADEAMAASIAEAQRLAREAAEQARTTAAQLEQERLDKQLLEANPAALAVPERRAYFRDLYDQRADKALTPQQWLASEAVTKHPVASLLLQPTAPPPPTSAPLAPNPLAGTQPGNPAPHGGSTPEEIRAAGNSPATWRATAAKHRAALEQRLGVSISPSSAPKG